MGVGTLGFLKGASSQVLSSLEARDEAERALKKQKELEKFRADLRQQEEMKKAVTFQTYTDAETGKTKVVGYNSQNQRLDATARDATQSELDAQKQSKEDRGWLLKERGMKEKDFSRDEEERAQRMRLEAARAAREERSSSIDNQYKRSLIAGAGGSKGSTGMSSGSAGVADLLLNDYSDDIKSAGITTDQARTIATKAVTTLLNKGVKDPDVLYSSARAGFESGISRYIKSMTAQGIRDKDDTYTKFRTKRFALDGSK